MPTQVTNYKCPNCGGPLHFDSDAQLVKCDYCDSQFSPDEIELLYTKKNEDALQVAQENAPILAQWTEEEARHMRAYTCPSCKAELICDENTAATRCPYCDNPTIVPSQFEGALKPDYIIPFKLGKEEATNRLKKFYRGKPLLPSSFQDANHIEEIKGVYVPFWLYNGTAHANMSFHTTRTNTYITGHEQVTETNHYQVVRQGNVTFKHIPADASSKMPDDFMDSLEPFNYEDLVPFQMSYLPGYLADKFDVSAQDNRSRADVRMTNTTYDKITSTVVGYSSVVPEFRDVGIRHDKVSYAFFPIWVLSTRYNGKVYLFTMNGQTGKMVGDDLPMSGMKFFLYFLGITLLFILIGWVLLLR